MAKSKKKKKNTQLTGAEREAQRREKQEMQMKQSRHVLYMIAALIILVALSLAILFAFPNRGTPNGYTAEQFQRLQSGMPYERVVKIMNGDEGTADGTNDKGDKVFHWTNEDGTGLTVTFRDDKVQSFKQDGLIN